VKPADWAVGALVSVVAGALSGMAWIIARLIADRAGSHEEAGTTAGQFELAEDVDEHTIVGFRCSGS
jgi:hypothetical protein